MYNYAIQFEPNNRRLWQGPQEVTALRDGNAIPAIILFWAAPVFYLIVALLDEHFSV